MRDRNLRVLEFTKIRDMLSSLVTVIGTRIASRPADREHPYGHGRMEYIVSLAAAALIFTAAYELFLNGIRPAEYGHAIVANVHKTSQNELKNLPRSVYNGFVSNIQPK